ncbi:hypothetical protein [Nocardia sp. NPDC047654]|uniref:hypothetical protein n=1 Tax=Nocardia sp. NPDC047654 TaxID=3364314 RepID=UPI00370FCA71
MTPQTTLTTDTSPSPWPTVAATVILLTVITSVLLTAFAWPSVRSSVHDVPIAVAGPPAAVAQLRTTLDQRLPGGFDITEVTATATAEQLIRDRKVYGAIDLSSGAPQIIIASAAGTAVAQTPQTIATGHTQSGNPGNPTTVRDLVALPVDDPRGAGLAAASLFPSPERILDLSDEQFRQVGAAFPKCALRAAARAFLAQGSRWEKLPPAELVTTLQTIDRAGGWTARTAVADYTNDFSFYDYSDIAVQPAARRLNPDRQWPQGARAFKAAWEELAGDQLSAWTLLTLAWGINNGKTLQRAGVC